MFLLPNLLLPIFTKQLVSNVFFLNSIRHEHNWRPRHPTILCFNIPNWGLWRWKRIRRGPENRSNLSYHESLAYFQACPSLIGITINDIDLEKQLQRTWSTLTFLVNGGANLFKSLLLCWKGRGGYGVHQHSGLFLVGTDHDDVRVFKMFYRTVYRKVITLTLILQNCRIWWHLSDYPIGKTCR